MRFSKNRVLKIKDLHHQNWTKDLFSDSLLKSKPPENLSGALTALWWDKKGNWARAHETAQDVGGKEGAWVHAYLHRKEGDLGNASYWYHRAGRPKSSAPMGQEWKDIVAALLAKRADRE